MKFTELPQACPECGEAFSSYYRPQRKWQKKAWLLFLIGIAVTFPWGLFLMFVVSQLGLVGQGQGRRGGGRLLLLLPIILFAPAAALGTLALKMPKVITLNCRHCNWKQPYLIDNRG